VIICLIAAILLRYSRYYYSFVFSCYYYSLLLPRLLRLLLVPLSRGARVGQRWCERDSKCRNHKQNTRGLTNGATNTHDNIYIVNKAQEKKRKGNKRRAREDGTITNISKQNTSNQLIDNTTDTHKQRTSQEEEKQTQKASHSTREPILDQKKRGEGTEQEQASEDGGITNQNTFNQLIEHTKTHTKQRHKNRSRKRHKRHHSPS